METAPINLKVFLQSGAVKDRGIGAWWVPDCLCSLEFRVHFAFPTVSPVDQQQTQIYYQEFGHVPAKQEATQRQQQPIDLLTDYPFLPGCSDGPVTPPIL